MRKTTAKRLLRSSILGLAVIALVGCSEFDGSEINAGPAAAPASTIESDGGDAQVDAIPEAESVAMPEATVTALSSASLDGATALRYGIDLSGDRYTYVLLADGSHGSETDGGTNCTTHYDATSMERRGYCRYDEGGGFEVKWTNVPSSGYESKKYSGPMTYGSLPGYVGASTDPGPMGVNGFASAKLEVARDEDHDHAEVGPTVGLSSASEGGLTAVWDAESGLAVAIRADADLGQRSGPPYLKTRELLISDQDLGLRSLGEEVDRLLATEARYVGGNDRGRLPVDFGFRRMESVAAAQAQVGYEIPQYDPPTGFELADVFLARHSQTIPLAERNPPSVDVVMQVFRRGLRELVITSRAVDPASSPDAPDELGRLATADQWQNDPLDYAGYGIERVGAWSPLVRRPDYPLHFWGIDGEAVVVVEGYLMDLLMADVHRSMTGN